ncbi:MAG: type II toxin-antitoxin system prevent-host-death family antitoxin [Solirubrobacterales bacterium]|nr:type II toxin-antitoxin system prevent-host-death family antitoxin [Solirubrobacterales bacterium]
MREIGVRELKAGLSGVLRAVAEGEPVRVTRRGQPIADIVPAAARRRSNAWEKLIAEGRVTPSTMPHPAVPPVREHTGISASDTILAERDEER